MSAPAIDVESITAIDVHVHAHLSVADTPPAEESSAKLEAMGKHFKTGPLTGYTVPQIAAHYRERNMACVVFTVDTIGTSGREPVPSSEEVAEQARDNADVIIPFASVDPARGKAGIEMARCLIEDFGVRGFKFHPNTQAFMPNDPIAYGLYELIAEHELIALFHSGQTGVGSGMPGGGGVRLKYSNPMAVDDVAADFPDMKIILAHPSFPWQDEALAVAVHKPNVHIDLSGWSPKYFPDQLVHYANTMLKHKVLFGSDFPIITPDRWLADFENLPIRPEVRPLILKDNAARLFGLVDTRESSA